MSHWILQNDDKIPDIICIYIDCIEIKYWRNTIGIEQPIQI